MKSVTDLLLAIGVSAACSQAAAQSLLIPDITRQVIMEFDAITGALIDPVAIDLAALTGGLAQNPIEAFEAPNGEIWVSDQTADAIFRISPDGSTYLGTVSAPLDQCRGMAPAGQGALVANSGTGNGAQGDSLVEIDGTGGFVSSTAISDPFDIEPYTHNGVPGYLVSDLFRDDLIFVEGADYSNQTIFHDSNGIAGLDAPRQVHVSRTGRVFAAGTSTPVGVFEFNSAGAQIDFIDVGAIGGLSSVRGVYLLGNGNLLMTAASGVHIYDTVTQTISTELSGVTGFLISIYNGVLCSCANYCAANPNSTGLAGRIYAEGSSVAADNDLALTAFQLPALSFGFFITSRTQGFVANPGGSAGNLCLSGSVGRYVGAGQIQNSGGAGSFSLTLDLTQTPQPLGFVGVMAGDTWNYQAWFRDSVGGVATSNFTDAVAVEFE